MSRALLTTALLVLLAQVCALTPETTTSTTSTTSTTISSSTAPSTATASTLTPSSTTSITVTTSTSNTTVPSSSSTSTTVLDRAFETECITKANVMVACLAATWNDPSVFDISEGQRRLGSLACNETCFAARQWVFAAGNFTVDPVAGWKIPSRAAQCKDAIGIRGSSILAASRSVLDESCLGLPPYDPNAGASGYCHLAFQHMLFAKNMTVDKFVADLSVLPKDTVCSPCVRALVDYDMHVLESVNGPKPEPVTMVLTETITRVLTGSVVGTTTPTATATTTLVATSTPIVWPQAKPAIPDKEAIQRIRDYCKWTSGRDLTNMRSASMTATAGVVGALMAVVLATVTFVVASMMPV